MCQLSIVDFYLWIDIHQMMRHAHPILFVCALATGCTAPDRNAGISSANNPAQIAGLHKIDEKHHDLYKILVNNQSIKVSDNEIDFTKFKADKFIVTVKINAFETVSEPSPSEDHDINFLLFASVKNYDLPDEIDNAKTKSIILPQSNRDYFTERFVKGYNSGIRIQPSPTPSPTPT